MSSIVNRIAEVGDSNGDRRRLTDIEVVMWHRLYLDRCNTAIDYAEAFRTNPALIRICGGHMPYTFVFCRNGAIHQALPLQTVAPHARAWSRYSIGCAVVGLLDRDPMTIEQVESVRWFNRWMGQYLLRGWSSLGHVDANGIRGRVSTGDPSKQCPGRNLVIDELNESTLYDVRLEAKRTLQDAGLVL